VIIMGVDPGSRSTGLGVIQSVGNHCRCLHYEAFRAADGGDGIPERLLRIFRRAGELIRELGPEVVAVEGVFYARNVRSALILGHARGAVLLAAAESGIPVVEYSPLEVKKSVVGYGRAEKVQVQAMVMRLLNLPKEPEPHDAADALAIALCHAFQQGRPAGERQSWRSYRV
jgi:crossover junction endodeoxyribonuclease RuvC